MTARRLYLCIDELAQHNRPVLVTRTATMTLMTWDPRASRQQVLLSNIDQLEPDELEQLWAAYALTLPLPPWTSRDESLCLYVPATLRLHGAPAWQGGEELIRRIVEGEIVLERALEVSEQEGVMIDLQVVDDLTYA